MENHDLAENAYKSRKRLAGIRNSENYKRNKIAGAHKIHKGIWYQDKRELLDGQFFVENYSKLFVCSNYFTIDIHALLYLRNVSSLFSIYRCNLKCMEMLCKVLSGLSTNFEGLNNAGIFVMDYIKE